MTSVEIAELTGKRHDHVMTDIKKMLNELGEVVTDYVNYGVYGNNNSRKIFELPENLCSILLDRYKGLNRVPHRLREESSLKTIEQLLGITLIRQYHCLGYFIDGYDKHNNVAYEIDEERGHRYTKEEDAKRQSEIENALGCKFIRINV